MNSMLPRQVLPIFIFTNEFTLPGLPHAPDIPRATAPGLVALVCAKAFGADAVAITDVRQEALDKARELGADHTLRIEAQQSGEDVADRVKALACRDGFDVVIDCAGFESTMRVGDGLVGEVVVVGRGFGPSRGGSEEQARDLLLMMPLSDARALTDAC